MKISNSEGWIVIENEKSTQNKSEIKGKYMFFADDKQQLIDLAKKLLEKYDLIRAKTPIGNTPNKNKGFGFVLCVYDTINRYCDELKEYETSDISFRYWKSDSDTRRGKYSKRFMSNRSLLQTTSSDEFYERYDMSPEDLVE